jgi:hypothetical protein
MPSETIIGSGGSSGNSSMGGGSAQAAAGRLLDAQGEAVKSAAAQTDQIIDSIRRQPVTAALVIFGIGYLLGKIT